MYKLPSELKDLDREELKDTILFRVFNIQYHYCPVKVDKLFFEIIEI